MRRSAWTVAKAELRGYFDHPTAYILVVAFLGLSLFLTFRTMYASGAASMRPFFDLLPILLAIFVPAATMRSLAEEKRGGTLEWLSAHPLDEIDLVVGKFLGNWLFVCLTLAGSLPTSLGLLLVSEADPGILIAQYVGAALLAAQLVALGLWASSLTRNQISAFILAALLSFVLFLIGLPVVQIGLPPLIGGALAKLSVVSHFQNVARGVLDLRDVLYFLSTGALFLVLGWVMLLRERLSRTGADYGRLRLGTTAVVGLVLVLNLLGGHIRGRLDLTRENLFTLAPGTRAILRNLDDLVQVKLFVSAELPPELQLQLRDVRDLLADLRRASNGNLAVQELDPDKDDKADEEASSLGIYPIDFNILRDNEFQVKRGYYGLAVLYADQREVIPVIQRTDDLEYRLASAIQKMTRQKKPTVLFAQGYGAKADYDLPDFRNALGDRYTLRTLWMDGDSLPPISPDSIQVVVVAGPTQRMDSAALTRIREYVNEGGSLLLFLEAVHLDPQGGFQPIPVYSGLEPFIEEFGVHLGTRMVADLASNERVSLGQRGIFNIIAPYPLWPVVRRASDHVITRSLSSLTLGWAGYLEITDSVGKGITPLWQTTEAGIVRALDLPLVPDQDWSVPPDQLGVRTVAVAVDPGAEDGEGNAGGKSRRGRMVVVADLTFLEPQFARANPQNAVFAANALDWLAQDEALIRIRSKVRVPPTLAFTSDWSRHALKWGNLVGVPVLFVLFGIWRVTGRRRRAEGRWKEVMA